MSDRRLPASLILVAMLASGLSCGGSTTTPTRVEPSPYVYQVPEATDDGWPTASLADVGLDPIAFEAIVERTGRDEGLALHGLLLVRDGHLVLEAYFGGWSRATRHEVQSVSKSFRSALVGIAIDQGLIEGVVRIVPSSWVEESVRRHHRTPNGGWRAWYGYQWWSGRESVQGREVVAFAAWGGNGQGIGVFPELGLVVVVTAGDPTANAPFRVMLEEIVPAVLAAG